MSLWTITSDGPKPVATTQLKEEHLLEEHLEDWIATDPNILGEPLLVIGRQVLIPDTKDRLDLLAVDPQGYAVIIELKRGKLRDPVDIQALRYASYIAKWQFDDFENLAKNYIGEKPGTDFNFNERFESFCEESGAEEVPDLNGDQRIIIAGSSVRDKLGSVALWLRAHSVEIKLIEIHAYKESDRILIEPTVVVPVGVSKFHEVGKIRSEGSPWITDGRKWHLDKRCSTETREVFLLLDKLLQELLELDGPKWNQKHYVAYRLNNYNWLSVQTHPQALWLDVSVKAGTFNLDTLAKQLGVTKFEKDESLSEKLALPSSVTIRNRNETTDRVRIRAKADFDLKGAGFKKFLKEAYAQYAKQPI